MKSDVRDTPWVIAAIAVALLAGCSRSESVKEADNKIVCTLDAKAFKVQPNIGDTSFVQRLSEADPMCKGMTNGK